MLAQFKIKIWYFSSSQSWHSLFPQLSPGVSRKFPSWLSGSIWRLCISKYSLIIRWRLLYVGDWMTVNGYSSEIWTRFHIVDSTLPHGIVIVYMYCCLVTKDFSRHLPSWWLFDFSRQLQGIGSDSVVVFLRSALLCEEMMVATLGIQL